MLYASPPPQDRRTDTTTRMEPTIDDDQDWNLLNGTEDGGMTTLEFSRLLDTEDLTGDTVIGQVLYLQGMHLHTHCCK